MPESDNPWVFFIEEQESRFSEKPPQSIKAEDSFRTAIEGLCKKYKEPRPQRLLSGLCSSYAIINDFAEVIARAQGLPPDAISGLIWGASIVVIRCGCSAGTSLMGVAKLVARFNNSIPSFSTDLGLFPGESSVQEALQDIFREYIEFHLSIFSYFHDITYTSIFDPSEDPEMKKRVADAAKALNEAKDDYDNARTEVEQKLSQRPRVNQARRQKDPHLTNGVSERDEHQNDLRAVFIFQRWLGRGSQGEVHEVMEPTTGQFYARKQVHFREDSSSSDEQEVLNEVAIMQKLRHPHIATVLFFVKESDAFSFIMHPVADCDLLVFLHRCITGRFKAKQVKRIYSWFGSLVDALSYAHDKNVKHRDIKPSNILIKANRPYLSDFGIARDFTGSETSSSNDDFAQGTPVYRAPETSPSNARGRAADVFALGCVFSEMLTVNQGKSLQEFREFRRVQESDCGPFAFRENLNKVIEWVENFEDEDSLSGMIVDQIRDMLEEEPAERARAKQVYHILKRETAFFCWD